MAQELSKRAQEMLDKRDFLDNYAMMCLQDPYNPDTNKKGYVNLGTSVSSLCEDIVLKRLNEPGLFDFGSKDQHYFPMWGIPECRESIASCLTRHLTPNSPLNPDNVLVVNGGVAAMEVLACFLFDPGDVLLTPSPCYTRIFVNFNERFQVHVEDVFLREKNEVCNEDNSTFQLSAHLLEATIQEQKAKGRIVKAFFLVNPNNPLGEVYRPELVLKLMEVCHRYGLHFISDEAYAMSIYDLKTPFQSVLSMHPLLDPQKTHIIWAFSKDMNLAGMRLGALITWNESLLRVVKNTSMYTAVPAIVQQAAAKLLNDTVWMDDVLLPAHKQRLHSAADKVRTTLISLGVNVRPSHAGFFLWADFKHFLPVLNHAEELTLFKQFIAHKVYITPGSQMRSSDPGWFRVVFSAAPHILDEGLLRIADTLKDIISKRQNNIV